MNYTLELFKNELSSVSLFNNDVDIVLKGAKRVSLENTITMTGEEN